MQLHAQEPHLAELLGELTGGELAALVPVLDLGEDPPADPFSRRIANRAFIVAQQDVELEEVEGVERG